MARIVNKNVTKVKPTVFKSSVKSTNLKSVEYNSVTKILTILFNTDRTYQYLGVPQIVYTKLLSAKSKGTYFNNNIKNRYKYKET